MDLILLYESKDLAAIASRAIYEIDCRANGKMVSPPPENMFGIYENILSGQVGLHVPENWWPTVPVAYQLHIQRKTPLWIGENWINGSSFFFIGNSPFGFGFGQHDPSEARKILEGNFSPSLIEQVRMAGREYSEASHREIDKLIEELNSDKGVADARLNEVNAYQFEELVAALLRNLGFDTFLTRKSGDGGKDIIAVFYDGNEQYIVLVECKRRNANKTFGPADVRALYGQFCFEQKVNGYADCAMLVTSAGSIGPAALDMEEQVDELSIKDRNDLFDWLRQYGNIKDGLWVHKKFKDIF